MPNEIIKTFKGWSVFKKRFMSFIPEECFLPENKDKCWEWQGPKRNSTYGTLSWGGGSHYLAHRIAYLIFKGPITDNLLVRHTCDNPICVNPAHLILGTHTNNMQDMIKAGNAEKNVLNEEAVKVIRWMLKYKPKRGLSAKLARLYKVNPTTISAIKNNHQWGWVKV